MHCIFFRPVALMTAVVTAVPLSLSAQQQPVAPFVASHPVLAASLARLQSGSPAWREAADAVAATGRRAVVVSLESELVAGARPVVDEQSRVNTVVVFVNLALLQRMSGLPVASVEFEDDVDRLLAHEVFGHAVPFLLAGHLAGKCADPERGQRATDACAIKRENVIRKDLRLGLRFDHGRDSLSSSRRYRQ
jgi:hypothetical protein